MGLQLEQQQRVLGSDVAATGLHPTDGQCCAMMEHTSKLRCKIVAWIDVQHKFFPGLANIRACKDKVHVHAAEAQPILGVTVTVKDAVFLHKYRLWVGIAAEALHDVCVQDNMHSADKLAALNEQTNHFHDPERKKKRKGKKRWKGHKVAPKLSWIWVNRGESWEPGDDVAMNEAVRIAWAKTRARAMRWTEEVDLLEEEMRHIVEFLQWRSGWWKERANIQATLMDGLGRWWVWGRLRTLTVRMALGGAENGEGESEEGEGESEAGDSEEETPISKLPQRPVKATYMDENQRWRYDGYRTDEDTDIVRTIVETIGLGGADGDLNLVASLRACFLQSDARENGDPNRGSLDV
ncbi:hypothetical protein B0H14DRAFT_3519387 [Mycena olivaceomarginata]|nr:hypothetical protein B0H14DRAFT_3519387 [Mycena olivaceomarginata]